MCSVPGGQVDDKGCARIPARPEVIHAVSGKSMKFHGFVTVIHGILFAMPTPGLRRQLFTLFALVIILIAALASTVWKAISSSTDHSESVAHTYHVQAALKRLDGQLRDATASQRGYLLSDARSFLADYYRALPRLESTQVDLIELVRSSPDQSQRVKRLVQLVELRLAQLDDTLAVYSASGLAAAQRLLAREDRIALENELAALTNQIDSVESELLVARQRLSADSHRRSLWLAGIALATSALALILAFALVLREQDRRRRAENETRSSTARLEGSLAEMLQLTSDLRELTVFGERLQSCRTRTEVIDAARHTALDLLPGLAGTVYLVNPSHNQVESAGEWGQPSVPSESVFAPDACWCLRRGQPHETRGNTGAQICAHVQADKLTGCACLCLPLVAQGENLGLLFLNRTGALDTRDRQLGTALAEQLSLALANQKLQDTLRAQSIRDPLTGLFNRRYLEASFNRELTRSSRQNLALAVMMLDLDHFKRYNDDHGHDAGDQLLSGFGQLLLKLSRREDIACRYGGEEFTVILTETRADQAVARAEKIRADLSDLSIPFRRRNLAPATVSIGIAVFPQNGSTQEELMHKADAALYAAKRAGRNQVVLAD